MKKQILSIFAAATMLLATSCSEEEMTYESASKQNVSFKIQVEGADVGSRTIADGTNHITIGKGQMVNKLFYAVYETGVTECLMEGEADVNNGLATVVIPLVNGLHFDLVFLAYNDKNNIFGIPETLTFSGGLCSTVDLENLTMKNRLEANQEAYDAFYHVESDYVTNTNSTSPVTLRRMLAQLNVATTDNDLSQAKQLKADITHTAIELSGVPNKFNARTGVASGETTVSYGVSDILKCSAKPEGQVHENEQLKVNIDGVDKNFNYLAMAYVLANKDESSLHDTKVSFYRTKGSDVELVHTRTIATLPIQRQFRTNLTGNILTQQEAFDISLDVDFGNKNVSVGDVVVAGNLADLQAAINNAQSGVPVEIQLGADITLDAPQSRATNLASAALTIQEGRIIILDLNGKEITTIWEDEEAEKHYYAITNAGQLTIKDNNGEGKIIARGINNYGKLTLEGGTINACDHNGGYAVRNYEGAEFVMNGGAVVTSNEDGDAPGSGYDATPIRIDVGAKATINGGTITNVCNYTLAIDNQGELTINGGTYSSIHTTVGNSGTLTINGGSFTCDGLEGITAHALWASSGTTTINGGTFDGKDNYNGFNVDASKDAKVEINGGKFLNVHSGSLYGEGTIVVSGGEFFDKIDAKYLASGYTVDEKNGVYVVSKPQALIDFENAIANGGSITLSDDLTLISPVEVPEGKSVTINLNGKTITGTTPKNEGPIMKNNGTLTITGGKISSTGANGGSAIANYGNLIVENATIEGASVRDGDGWPSYPINNYGPSLTLKNTTVTGYQGAVACNTAGTVILDNCTINKEYLNTSSHIFYINHADAHVIVNGGDYKHVGMDGSLAYVNAGKITVNGGTFTASDGGYGIVPLSNGTVEINGGTFNNQFLNWGGSITITGGKFKVNPKAEWVADGYQAIKYSGSEYYTIQAFNASTRTITINSLEEFLNLNALNNEWANFFSNGKGTEYSNYATQNNGKGADFYYKWDWTIKLNVDINLEDATTLVPTNLEGFGYFDGNGHTIKNATITSDSDAGLFRAGHAAVKNLNLDNVKVKGGNDASVGILTSDCHASVDKVTIANSSVEGGKYAGGVVGYGYCDVTDCTLTNCSVKGCYKFGGVIGYICASGDENLGIVNNNTLNNCTVAWTGNYSTGKNTVVMGKVVGNFNCDGTCQNNVISNMTTTATALIGKIEDGKNVAN